MQVLKEVEDFAAKRVDVAKLCLGEELVRLRTQFLNWLPAAVQKSMSSVYRDVLEVRGEQIQKLRTDTMQAKFDNELEGILRSAINEVSERVKVECGRIYETLTAEIITAPCEKLSQEFNAFLQKGVLDNGEALAGAADKAKRERLRLESLVESVAAKGHKIGLGEQADLRPRPQFKRKVRRVVLAIRMLRSAQQRSLSDSG